MIVPTTSGTSAALVTIGDELLLGDRLDTNAAWIARALSDWGFEVRLHLSVGDDEARIGWAIDEALEAGEVVVVTGGLGPTSDDRTREGVAGWLGVSIEESAELVAALEARARERGGAGLSHLNRRLAGVPAGGVPLHNSRGSAPALLFEIPPTADRSARLLALLPGVPAEMKGFMEGEVGERIRARRPADASAAVSCTVHTSGLPESVLAESVEGALPSELALKVAYRPSILGVEIRLSAEGDEAEDRLRRGAFMVEELLAPYRIDHPDGDLAATVGRALSDRGQTIAVAESCTGGLMAKRLTDIPGSSSYFLGGVVSYSDAVKSALVGVPNETLAANGAVSDEVARALAEGIRARLASDIGIGITGIAGPGGAVPGKPVGTVWFGVSSRAATRGEMVRFAGTRAEIRARAVQHALRLTLLEVTGA